jgi:hypothetical protein
MFKMILSIFMLISFITHANEGKTEYMHLDGKVQEQVKISFNDEDMEERSYESSCNAGLVIMRSPDSMSLLQSSYACGDGMQNDDQMTFKFVEGKVFMVNRWGDIDEGAIAVGTVSQTAIQVALSWPKKVTIFEPKIDDKGCPTGEVDVVEKDVTKILSLSFVAQEKGYLIIRQQKTQSYAPVPKRVEGCNVPFYRKQVLVEKLVNISGELQGR